MNRRNALLVALCASVVAGDFTAFPATAETFPSRPVKVIVAWPAGGFVDVVTRALTQKIAADWGNPIIVEPKPGAYGLIGTELVARSEPDGYTWLIGTLSTPMSGSLYKKPWHALDKFAGVAMLADSPLIAVVPATLPANSLADVVALAKVQPGKLNYLNPSIGSASHLNTELLKQTARVDLLSVPYNGQPPGVSDLLTGRLQFALLAPQIAVPNIKAGKLKALAVAFPVRLREFPDVPTFAEAGFPDANVVASYSILVPKQTPRDIVARIAVGIQKALADPEVRTRIEAAGARVAGASTPEQVDAFLKAETARWAEYFSQHKVNLE